MAPWKITSETSRSELLDGGNDMTPVFREAYEAWKTQRGTSALPAWRSARLLDFPRLLLPLAVVARHEPATGEFRVIYWGSHRTRLQNVDYTGRLISEYEPTLIGRKVQREHQEVRDRGAPLLFRSTVESRMQGRVEYYKIRLPYREPDKERADVVLSFDDPELIERRVYLAWQADSPSLLPE